jgi:ABC-2 type transport system ATP-binding protein
MISVKNVEKRYGDAVAVSGLSFDVQRGDIVGLLGHNGAGKTTIMKVMTGYLEPSAGRVTIDGLDVIEERQAAQRKIGYLPENAPLYPELQVQEQLKLMGELRGLKGAPLAQAINDALEATGLTARRAQTIQTLSKGYRQRVGLAQAILHKPDLLILDEPTNGLDPVQILEIRALIKRLAQDTTILLSTHILSEIEAVCDRVVILIQGHLAADASLEELMSERALLVSLSGAETSAQVTKALSALDGVTSEGVEVLSDELKGGGRLSLRLKPCLKPQADKALAQGEGELEALAERVSAALSAQGWTISQLAPQTQRLEDIFRDLMSAHVSRQQAEGAPTSTPNAQEAS